MRLGRRTLATSPWPRVPSAEAAHDSSPATGLKGIALGGGTLAGHRQRAIIVQGPFSSHTVFSNILKEIFRLEYCDDYDDTVQEPDCE